MAGGHNRHGKYSMDVHRKIVEAVSLANSDRGAALAAGITYATLRRWKDKGLADIEAGKTDTKWAKLVKDLEEAHADREATLHLRMQVAGRKDWRCWAYQLEKYNPEKYGKRNKHEITVKGGVDDNGAPMPLRVDLHKMSPEQLAAMSGVDRHAMGAPSNHEDDDGEE